MRSTCCSLLLGMVTLGGLGLAPAQAEAQLLPWRRPRVVYYAPAPVYYSAPAVSYYYAPPAVSYYAPPAVSYYAPPAVSYYYAPPAVSYYYAPPVGYLAPLSALSTAYAYGPALAPGAPPRSAAYSYAAAPAPSPTSSSSAYYQPDSGPTMNVSIHDSEFQPATINIFAGTTVAWHNDSATPHTITSDNTLFDSRSIPAGGSFRYTFNQPGSYSYHCTIHPQMRGTVVVQ